MMADKQEPLTWTTINDFSPGIIEVPGINHPLGSAAGGQDTYRCVAAENGALIPGPRVTREVHRFGSGQAAWENATDIAEQDGQYWISGMKTNPAAVYGGAGNPYPSVNQNNCELYFLFEYYTTAGNWVRKIERWRGNYADPDDRWQTIVTDTEAATYSALTTRPTTGRITSTRTRDNWVIATSPPGNPAMAFAFGGGADTSVVFPNPDTPTTNTTSAYPLYSGYPPHLIVGHQGHLVVFPLITYAMGDTQVAPTNEALYWTAFDDHTTVDSNLSAYTYPKAIAVLENFSGYQDVVSLTADTLLLLKTRGGAVSIFGDINDPTIEARPNVASPGISLSEGTISPVGYCYVQDAGGLWVWGGGDTSTFVSPQMEPDFWRPTVDYMDGARSVGDYYFHPTKLCQWGDWVVLPGSYLWDWRRNAFFKFAKRDSVFHDTDPKGRWLYASRSRFDNDYDEIVFEFDRTLGATFYKWTSNDIPTPFMREIRVREMAFMFRGDGRVKVTVETSDSDTALWPTRTFDVNSARPVAYRWPDLSVGGTNVRVVIESFGRGVVVAPVTDDIIDSTETAAPEVHAIHIGHHPGASV